jgi:hypothetical protein
MKTYDNGCFFIVTYNESDAEAFADEWPCSTVRGKGSWQFDKRNGDLVDATGSASRNDGLDWLAFSQDCQAHGLRTLEKRARSTSARS